MFENEDWVPIEEFPHYLISNYGRIKHVDRSEARKINVNERGFPVIAIISQASSQQRYLRQINKLVAEAFLPPPFYEDGTPIQTPSVWHIDGDLLNCRADNLRWDRRDRVLEWNEMHRPPLEPKYRTPPVKNNGTGIVYANAYECAMAEGVLESYIITRIEKQARHIYADNARYRYVTD